MLTQEELMKLLHYEPSTGIFTWKFNGVNVKKGQEAGTISDGYYSISIKRKKYFAHRLAFLYMLGEMPSQVDHINGLMWDNKWSNLRPATRNTNNHNSKLRIDNTSGVKGVCFHKASGKYRAKVMLNNKDIDLGLFETIAEAEIIVRYARERLHKEFCNHG